MASAPVLVLGNKIDKAGAASEDEIRHWLGLHGQTTGKVSLWFYLLMMLCQQCFSGKCPPDNFYVTDMQFHMDFEARLNQNTLPNK